MRTGLGQGGITCVLWTQFSSSHFFSVLVSMATNRNKQSAKNICLTENYLILFLCYVGYTVCSGTSF